ncbi:glutamine--fructose-6-phosphate transaminase (isomerizing) [Rhodospirillum rubrum]|uniref:glutamine--fructose-6-phosphate transaminase (isomerizing) n=1 Tax=Rhodospirillum rubrum TaxID=1085 RepID=UPI00190590E7|nr:glutamine--fructose-6-phosphate transaminase (isomerizing) [Rhodospirillum rubrum]MBK1664464.1 glutamine--fructose-6-phosphate transaminase (isomerizing) [Rhodospirillum rubrum]MBK1676170.1 glutamine--fructose-6-phosphate transaminase (isomerizing) [Rhodospirillum rubrum]
MCGIIGIIGVKDVVPSLMEGLRRLEYRGYDSTGIATLVDGVIDRRRAQGKLGNLEKRLVEAPLAGVIGIGHTRWATHGVPNEVNAHPHASAKVAVVHNGIIENFVSLRDRLLAKGHVFATATDTEAVVHLITEYLDEGLSPEEAVGKAIGELEGAFALVILIAGEENLLFAARKGSPLAVGYGDGEMFLGSDALTLAPLTRRIAYLEDGDWVRVTREGAVFRDVSGALVERKIHLSSVSGAMIGKGGHRHYMLKEIYEQPQVIGDTLNAMFNPVERTITLPPLPFALDDVERVTLIACGTSSYAAMVARYWIESIARVPVDLDVGSEFRYRDPPLQAGGLALFISQSGETADTLAALRHCKAKGLRCLSIVNVAESTMARESDAVLTTLAGPEIGVASTKAFTTQLVVLACLTIALARARGQLDADGEARLSKGLTEVPARAAEILKYDEDLRAIAQTVAEARDVLYLGRGTAFPIALEGALKLKEISYIHAEGYAAGEMKHGPIALIDETVPVIVIAPSDGLFDKTASNVQEVVARGGKVIFLSDSEGNRRLGVTPAFSVVLPAVDPFVAPILYAIPVQLLAYHVAVIKGTDVDQPRNLAKSVTVE